MNHLQITPGGLEAILDRVGSAIASGGRLRCIPLNVTKYVRAKRDARLRQAILAADLVIADGAPIAWLARRLGYEDVVRVTGIDLAETVLARAAGAGWRVFLFGASPDNLAGALARLRERFPGLPVAGSRDGYYQPADVPAIIDQVNASGAEVLLLGLGLPQKEYFLLDHSGRLDAPLCLAVGGAFDVWSGAKRRTPPALQKLGLEWVYRSFFDWTKAWGIYRCGVEFGADYLRAGRPKADRRPPTTDRRPPTRDRRPETADRRP